MVNFSFRQFNDSKLFLFVGVMVQRLKNDPQFVSFKPQLETLTTVFTAFSAVLADPQSRRADKDVKRQDLLTELNLFASAMENFSKGDNTIEAAAGFETRKTTITKVTNVTMPSNFSVFNTERTREVRASWKRTDDALNYALEYRIKGENIWQSGNFTTKREIFLSDFEPGTYVEFKVRTLGRGELKSDWTPIVGVWIA